MEKIEESNAKYRDCYIFRMIFNFPDETTAGTLLIVAETIELAISRGCQALYKKEGKRPEVNSIGRLFLSIDEENDFFKHIVPLVITK